MTPDQGKEVSATGSLGFGISLATTQSASAGSNIGGVIPVILLLAVVGLVIYVIRLRRGKTPKDRDE